MCKIGDHSVPGLFAGTTGEKSSSTNNVAVKCPVHKSRCISKLLDVYKLYHTINLKENYYAPQSIRIVNSSVMLKFKLLFM